VTSWGRSGSVWQLALWALVGPPMAVVAAFAGSLLTALVVLWPHYILTADPRFWEVPPSGLMAIVAVGAGAGVVALLLHFPRTLGRRVLLSDDDLVVWTALGRTTIRWDDVVRAFVTTRRGGDSDVCLHVWTRWREVAVSSPRLVGTGPDSVGEFEAFLRDVDARLDGRGKHLEGGVPASALTHVSDAVRYALFWPHRRYLAWRLARDGDGPVADHRAAPVAMALGWVFRPAPVAAAVAILSLTALVRFGTTATWAPTALAFTGLLGLVALPAWNALKDRWHRLMETGTMRPEELVGGTGLPSDLPHRLVPAPGCEVDFEARRVRRPDGRTYSFDDISVVVYGPTRAGGVSSTSADSGLPVEPWQMAVRTLGVHGAEHEVYHNASVDVIRHGDLDGGYAAFNWVLAREVALRSEADLQLAQGRVRAGQVGRPLVERLATDVVRYDPESVRSAFGDRAPQIRIEADDEKFEAWGPLTRFPEGCATPPLYRLLIAAVCLAITPWLPPASLLAGYLIATSGHDLIMQRHFARPGFRMDKEGVWVRGERLSWEELEHATLLPVSPGPILFAGPRTVLVPGYLGGTYRERAWLGCAAWRWIQDHVCEVD
jgi:hypothetical protein